MENCRISTGLWFSEKYSEDAVFSIRAVRQHCAVQSKYQSIEVYESPEFGRFLIIDGIMMLTERDEFIYHVMITHVPMAVHPNVKNVLVIGGGDGGTLRELSRYKGIESIDIVEIDEEVIKVCKEFIPKTACGFNDPRVNVYIEDGIKFVAGCKDKYDLIIVDSTDPIGPPGEGLFTLEFYKNCHDALRADGIMVNQHGGPFYEVDIGQMKRSHERIYKVFPISLVYQANIPTYASGIWMFGFASKKYHPIRDMRKDWEGFEIKTDYYNPSLHIGAFYLPTYVERMLKECES